MDDAGNQQVLELARATGLPGFCSTCTGTLGSEELGFRATVVGTVVPGSSPKLFNTQSVLAYEDGCPEGMTVIAPEAGQVSTEAGGVQSTEKTHGSLMLVSWGFLLPFGIITARFLRHRPNNLWFKMHRVLQILGLIIAIAGWAIALKNFDVLGSGGGGTSSEDKKAYAHACCGTAAMSLGLLQPLNALLRPHPPTGDEPKAKPRLLWELLHKSMGYIGTILALVTIGIGTRIISVKKDQFLIGYIVSLVVLAVIAFIMIVDGIRYKKKEANEKSKDPNAQSSTTTQEVEKPQPEVEQPAPEVDAEKS